MRTMCIGICVQVYTCEVFQQNQVGSFSSEGEKKRTEEETAAFVPVEHASLSSVSLTSLVFPPPFSSAVLFVVVLAQEPRVERWPGKVPPGQHAQRQQQRGEQRHVGVEAAVGGEEEAHGRAGDGDLPRLLHGLDHRLPGNLIHKLKTSDKYRRVIKKAMKTRQGRANEIHGDLFQT